MNINGDNMMKKLSNAITVVLIVCVGPFLINLLFKNNAVIYLFQAEWDAGDALGFYGCLVGAVIAVVSLMRTIHITRINYEDDIRNRALPFLAINELCSKERKNKYNYITSDHHFIVNKGVLEYRTELTSQQKDILVKGVNVNRDSTWYKYNENVVCGSIELENTGVGLAILHIEFSSAYSMKNRIVESTVKTLKVGEKLVVHIYVEDCGEGGSSLGEYTLDLCYADIYGNKYKQSNSILIGFDVETHVPVFEPNISHKQERCNVEKTSNFKSSSGKAQ